MNRRHKLLTVSRMRIVYLVIAIAAFGLTEFGRHVYRPYVYNTGLRDFGIADTMGNHLGTVALIYTILAVVNATIREAAIIVSVVVLGLIGYEFVQQVLPGSTFDMRDVTATVVGGLVTCLIYLMIRRLKLAREAA